LKQKNAELTKQFGVKSLSLFGSVARDEATSVSDVDLLVEFNRPVGYFGLFALQDYLENLLGCSVDLGTPDSLKPYIKERILGEIVHVTYSD
jgi:predicted nucleotidyltransferase